MGGGGGGGGGGEVEERGEVGEMMMKQCRICHEYGDEGGDMDVPCACNGTIKNIGELHLLWLGPTHLVLGSDYPQEVPQRLNEAPMLLKNERQDRIKSTAEMSDFDLNST
uniref:RING-CH-type domain-containing protein n=1 Tax=Ananas comosus var. bracteatus TaxID=296719 RepID=A0A6V7P0Z5_ANACO|nr:unnamed protein product [Ananas comosus var. bracteatus]